MTDNETLTDALKAHYGASRRLATTDVQPCRLTC
jgi:hypothetical protein